MSMPPLRIEGIWGTDAIWPEHPAADQVARELAELEAMGPGPFYVPPIVADAAIARWGRLPSNCEVLKQLPTVRPPMFPGIAAAGVAPARGAQWKRERSKFGGRP